MSILTFKSSEFKTFPAVLREYAAHTAMIKGNSEKTVCEYLLDLRTFFRFFIMRSRGEDLSYEELERIDIGAIGLEDVRRVSTENIIDFLMYSATELKNNPTTRLRKLSSLKSFFSYMYSKKHYIDKNPAIDVEGPKKKKALPKYLTLEECITLLETVKNDTTSKTLARDFCIISLFLNTGMRLSELVGLNLKSFDSDLTTVRVLGKGNKERIIYLNDAVREALKEYLRVRLDPKYVKTGEGCLFLSRLEKRISPKTVQWVVYKYLSLAGFGGRELSVHKLRHTAATLMFQSGKVDIRVLKDILGHEQLDTTQIYTHVVNRNLEDAVEQNPLSQIKIRRSTDE